MQPFTFLTFASAIAINLTGAVVMKSNHYDTSIDVVSTAPEANTWDSVDAFNEKYSRDTRVEKLDGKYVMIHHSTSTHVATVGGEVAKYLESVDEAAAAKDSGEKAPGMTRFARSASADPALMDRAPACRGTSCVVVLTCGKKCHVCYPVICL